MASRSAWTARAGAWTTSSSSGCGAVSNTRRSTSTLMRLWPKPRLALVAGWTFTTRSVSIRAWVIAHRVRSTRKACGHVDDRRRRPAALPPLPERARKPGKCSPSPTSPQSLQSTKRFILALRKAEALHLAAVERDCLAKWEYYTLLLILCVAQASHYTHVGIALGLLICLA